MVEIQVKADSNELCLLIDGEVLEKVRVTEDLKYKLKDKIYYDLYSNDQEINKKLGSIPKAELTKINYVKLENWFVWRDFYNYVLLESSFNPDGTKYYGHDEIIFAFVPKVENQSYEFSFAEYCQEFLTIFDKLGELTPYCELEFRIGDKFGIFFIFDEFYFQKPFESIIQVVKRFETHIQRCHIETIEVLKSTIDNQKISIHFDFPEELKIPCKQYLEYFAQFLRDLGVNVISDLNEAAGKVLFSVTPTDDIEALDKIREALAIYLSLSSNPIPNSTGDRTVDMVLSGARANAKHLESQLELAIAKLQFKEATLELKDATIEQHQIALRKKDETIKELQEIVSRGNIFEESLEKVEINGEVIDEKSLYRFSREDDIEIEATPISDENNEETRIGLVKVHEVTKFKDYGVSFDLPKAIRDLIDYFKRDKNSS